MNYCSECGSTVQWTDVQGENRKRFVCTSCKTIHYENPKIVVGTIPIWQNQILLCRRAIEPGYGLWTLPAGFMELNETLEEGASRETFEEATARVHIRSLHSVYTSTMTGKVSVFFLADIIDGHFRPGEESLETKLFKEEDLPWNEIPFHSVRFALTEYLKNKEIGPAAFGHVETI